MSSLLVSVAPEWAPARELLAATPGVEVRQLRSHVQYVFDDEIVLDRKATGLRHALWYSVVAGLDDARIEQFDKVCLRVVAA